MGIKNLLKFLNTYPDLVIEKDINEFQKLVSIFSSIKIVPQYQIINNKYVFNKTNLLVFVKLDVISKYQIEEYNLVLN